MRSEFNDNPALISGRTGERGEEADPTLIQREVFRIALEGEPRRLTLREALAFLDTQPEQEA